jgi:hypothetical protein
MSSRSASDLGSPVVTGTHPATFDTHKVYHLSDTQKHQPLDFYKMYPDRIRDCVKEVHKDWSQGYKDFQENLGEYITNGFKKEVEFVSFTGGG